MLLRISLFEPPVNDGSFLWHPRLTNYLNPTVQGALRARAFMRLFISAFCSCNLRRFSSFCGTPYLSYRLTPRPVTEIEAENSQCSIRPHHPGHFFASTIMVFLAMIEVVYTTCLENKPLNTDAASDFAAGSITSAVTPGGPRLFPHRRGSKCGRTFAGRTTSFFNRHYPYQ